MASPSRINIQGLDLKIDPNVQELCKVSNASSSQTRSVLYVLMLASSLALTAIISTSELTGWSRRRLAHAKYELELAYAAYDAAPKPDPIREAVKQEKERAYDVALRNHAETSRTVKIPILGHAFDVNNLGLLYGLTAAVILLVLNFTFRRETNNLQLALNAITERYPPAADWHAFEGIDQLYRNARGESPPFPDLLAAINLTRRRHHYNYLSMNEVFSSPPLSVDDRTESVQTWHPVLAYVLITIPLWVQLYVMVNDIGTISRGTDVSQKVIWVSLGFSAFFFLIIAWSTWQAATKKKQLQRLYREFGEHDFLYQRDKPAAQPGHGPEFWYAPGTAAP